MRRLLLVTGLLLSSTAAAAPLNPWGAEVGQGVFAVTPFLYVDQTPGFYPLVYGQYGFTDSFELLAGAGATLGSASSFDGIEVMPRYFFNEGNGMCLHVTWAPGGDAVVAPEYHGIFEGDALSLTVNAGWGPVLRPGGFANGTVYALIAPEHYFNEATSVFLEIDPVYDLNDYGDIAVDRLYMELVPGVGTAIADTHYFAFGLALPVVPTFSTDGIYFGAWYSYAFGGE